MQFKHIISGAAVLLASTPAVMALGSATVINNCGFPIYYASVGQSQHANMQLLQYKDAGESEIVLAIYKGHPLANATQVRMKDLHGESFLWPFRKGAPRYSDTLMRACVAHGVVPKVVQETATHSILLSLVAVGMGIGFVEYSEHRFQSSSVLLKQVVDLNVSFKIRLFWRRSDESVALNRFLNAMALPEESAARTSPAAPAGLRPRASDRRGAGR